MLQKYIKLCRNFNTFLLGKNISEEKLKIELEGIKIICLLR